MRDRRLYGRNGEFLRIITNDEARELIVSDQAESRLITRTISDIHLHARLEIIEKPLLHFPVERQPVYREYLENGQSGQGPWMFRRVWKAAQAVMV